jgi:hypothetical protein
MIVLKTEGNKTYAYVSVPPNYHSGHTSKAGNHFVYRVLGTYIASNGAIKGEEGQISTYLYRKLPATAMDKWKTYSKSAAVQFNNDGLLMDAFKILCEL